MIYGSRLPRLRYAFWRLVAKWNYRFNRCYVVYVRGEVEAIFRNERQAHEYADLKGGEINDDTPLYNRLTGRDAVVGAQLRKEGWP